MRQQPQQHSTMTCVQKIAAITEPIFGLLSVLYLIFAETTTAAIYPIKELALQMPLMFAYAFLLYMILICKHTKILNELKCLDRQSCLYFMILCGFRDCLRRRQIFQKLRIIFYLFLTMLKSPDMQFAGSPMFYDSEELTDQAKGLFRILSVSQLIVMWFILLYQLLYGFGRLVISVIISIICCPCLSIYFLISRGARGLVGNNQSIRTE